MLAGSRRGVGGGGGEKHAEALTSRRGNERGRKQGERCEEGKVNWANGVNWNGGSLPRDS